MSIYLIWIFIFFILGIIFLTISNIGDKYWFQGLSWMWYIGSPTSVLMFTICGIILGSLIIRPLDYEYFLKEAEEKRAYVDTLNDVKFAEAVAEEFNQELGKRQFDYIKFGKESLQDERIMDVKPIIIKPFE